MEFSKRQVLFSIFILAFAHHASAAITRACEHSTLHVSCPARNNVRILKANYGRTTGGDICPHSSVSNTNCRSSNSLSIVSNACDGERTCSVLASNTVFTDPCSSTYKYLEVDFVCALNQAARVCEGGTLQLSCPKDQTLQIIDGFYGRQAGQEICPSSAMRTTNCRASSSLEKLRDSCNGLNSCSVNASNSVFGDPCVGTYKYLEVLYSCA